MLLTEVGLWVLVILLKEDIDSIVIDIYCDYWDGRMDLAIFNASNQNEMDNVWMGAY